MSWLGLHSSGVTRAPHGVALTHAAAAGAARLPGCAAGAHAGLAPGGGSAQHSAPASTADHSGALGTSFYISPEIANGWAQYDEKVTLHFFQLLCVRWNQSCRRFPFVQLPGNLWSQRTIGQLAPHRLLGLHSSWPSATILCWASGGAPPSASWGSCCLCNMEPEGMCDGLS